MKCAPKKGVKKTAKKTTSKAKPKSARAAKLPGKLAPGSTWNHNRILV